MRRTRSRRRQQRLLRREGYGHYVAGCDHQVGAYGHEGYPPPPMGEPCWCRVQATGWTWMELGVGASEEVRVVAMPTCCWHHSIRQWPGELLDQVLDGGLSDEGRQLQ